MDILPNRLTTPNYLGILMYGRKERKGMDNDRDALLKEAEQLQLALVKSMLRQTGLPRWLGLNVSMAQLKGLFVLAHLQQTTISEFAEILHIGRSAASLLADRLVQEGLIERTEDPEDRRKMMIRLSDSGLDLVARLREEAAEHNQMSVWLAKLDPADLQALLQGLRALVAVAQTAVNMVPIPYPWAACENDRTPE